MTVVVAAVARRVVARGVVAQVLAAQEGAAAGGAGVAAVARVAARVPQQLAGRAERPAAVLWGMSIHTSS